MTKSTKQRTNGDDGMADEQIIELAGTKVDTLWTTVESGKLEDGTKYKKKQRLAPRTFEKAIQDDNGMLLSTKLEEMQQQIGSVGGNVIGNVENLETENKETIVGAINEVNANSDTTLERLINSGILSNALEHTSINEAFTFEDLISKKEITFFTNWSDFINFPELYGSGIFLPGYDTRCNSIIYTTSPTPPQKENRHVYIGYVFVAEEGGDNQGLTTGVEWKRLMTNDEVSNPNLLINPDFSINQRDGYIIKTGCTVYNEPALTTDVSNLGLSNKHRAVTYKTNTYAAFLGDNGYTYYVNINDIEKGYVGANIYTVDRWRFNTVEQNVLIVSDEYITLSSNNTNNDGTVREIQQPIEGIAKLRGKKLVFSVCARSTHQYVIQVKINSSYRVYRSKKNEFDGNWHTVKISFNFPEDGTYLDVRIGYDRIASTSANRLDIKWTKLELGSVATKFIPPQKSSELAKCKYYYQELIGEFSPYLYGDNDIYTAIKADRSMRVLPSYKFKNSIFNEVRGSEDKKRGVAMVSYWGGIHSDFAFSAFISGNEGNNIHYITVLSRKQAHGCMNNAYLVVGVDNPLCLDAEIY